MWMVVGRKEPVSCAVGAMDSVSDFESGGCGFESRIAYLLLLMPITVHTGVVHTPYSIE